MNKAIQTTTKVWAISVMSLGAMAALSAAEEEGELSPLTVVGSKDRVLDLVGSAVYIDEEDLKQQNYTSINRILAKVPGVYIREEDGYGNFPNISIRGSLGTRSEKTTIMEDGILSSPAAYSAPAAYYSPNAARMNAFEVLKGSSQIKYGPHTTGGVINYLSTPIPDEQAFYAKFTYGSDNTFLGHAHFGDTIQTENNGTFGYLLEMFYHQTDGFRDIQGLNQDTGFQRIEPMLKLFWEPDTALKQRFEFKYGYTEFDADETYLGLSERDVKRNPHDRYAATKYDNIDTFHHRTYLKYTAEPTSDFRLEAAGYYNRFNRNWYKLNKVNGSSLHSALLDPAKVTSLKGLTAGDIIDVKANNRDYRSYGAQFASTYDFLVGEVENSLTAGVRVHKDYVDRYQWVDTYESTGTGDFFLDSKGVHGSDSNRRQETVATSVFIEDEIKSGKLTLRPGVRFEFMQFDYDDYNNGTSRSDDLNTWAGGMGGTYELCETDRIFGGIYRGISTPSPKGYTDPDPAEQTDEETSISYELGWRHQNTDNAVGFELVGFYTDFDNLLAPAAGAGLGDPANGGEAEVYGIEAQITYDPAVASGQAYRVPMYISATWTSATLQENLATDTGNVYTDFRGGDETGNDIPYIPEWKLAAGVGVDFTQWGAFLDATWTSEMYGTGGNYSDQVVSSREGEIDEMFLVDLSAWYQINDNWRLIGGVYNIFDEVGVVSRLPEGPRTNQGRNLYCGFEVQF
ncbi:TonB-dependent receptor [Verrucomicrobiaceae bacterium N1E253]|uniref:TonB-dependent receptor n=1 Tax=Oceaniferula marina TaxID=2748318 RepID=A0A851GJJ5_9BACT|nr:TonB-dependent receptor [Oceaniferula marina]NWK54850.1 TonB-dependent receptor [Oceaniferula marina]